MIIKSSQRTGSRQLAEHLTNDRENERVTVTDARHLLLHGDRPVHHNLAVMDGLAAGSRCEKHLYHVSLNPDQAMTAAQWERAWAVYEQEYGLTDQPYIEVTHRKGGRAHKHRVYERVTQDGKAVHLSHTKIRNEKVARLLEYAFNHPLTIGKHNKAVMRTLAEEGHHQAAAWMEQGHAHDQDRPVAIADHTDHQQQKRTGVHVAQVKADLMDAYMRTSTGKDFQIALAEKGYILARGDRRDLVILDGAGGLHNPARRLAVKVGELRTRWADLDLAQLPTVEQVRQQRDPGRHARQAFKELDTDRKLSALFERLRAVEEQRRRLEQQLVQGGQQHPYREDRRKRWAEMNAAERRAVLERLGPRGRLAKPRTPGGRHNPRSEASIDRLRGKSAQRERDRRLEAALRVARQGYTPDPERNHPVQGYLYRLGRALRRYGLAVYQRVDRHLVRSMARKGYLSPQMYKALLKYSPSMMDLAAERRKAYRHRLCTYTHARYYRPLPPGTRMADPNDRALDYREPRQSSFTPSIEESLSPRHSANARWEVTPYEQYILQRNALRQQPMGRRLGEGRLGGRPLSLDQQVALKMYAFGYSRPEIQRAIALGNKAIAKKPEQQRHAYLAKHIDPILKSREAQQRRAYIGTWKQQHGISSDKRRIESLEGYDKRCWEHQKPYHNLDKSQRYRGLYERSGARSREISTGSPGSLTQAPAREYHRGR